MAVQDLSQLLKKKQFLPVYFLYGEDNFQVNKNLEMLEVHYAETINKDFDWHVYYEKNDLNEAWGDLVSFPFYSEKKLVIVRECQKRKAKAFDLLMEYITNPSESSILIIQYEGKIDPKHVKHSKYLNNSPYSFESKPLKIDGIEEWVSRYTAEKGKVITKDAAQFLIDQSGMDRTILEMQLDKIILYVGSTGGEITKEVIQSQNVKTKTYNVFEMENALGARKKELTCRIIYTLLDSGEEPLKILGFINSIFLKVTKLTNLPTKEMSKQDIAKALDTFDWKLDLYYSLNRIFPYEKRKQIVEAILKSDIAFKTSQFDSKTIFSTLLSEMFS